MKWSRAGVMATIDLRPVRPDYFAASPEALGVVHFASGLSRVPDLRGFSRLLYPIGVSIPELSPSALAELLTLADLPLHVFVDTGAFSEMAFGPEGPRVVAPIDDRGWIARVQVMHSIAARFGRRASIVAPDRVGDQGETLRRLARYADAVRACRELGARVVVPIQRGEIAPAAFDAAAAAALGISDFIRAIPGNKEAMPLAEIVALARARRPRAVHLLGIGPRGSRFVEVVRALRAELPEVEISCDSNLLAAHLGRSNGAGGGPRAITEASHAMGDRVDAIVMAIGGAVLVRRAIAEGIIAPPRAHAPPAARQLDLFDRI